MVWAALSVILALVITSVSANSSTSWNLAASAASAISPANNTPDNARPECTNASTWATPNFRPSDCYGALSRFHASRIVPPYRAVRTEFLIPGDRKRTELPSSVLPEQFVYRKSRGLVCPIPSNLQSRNLHNKTLHHSILHGRRFPPPGELSTNRGCDLRANIPSGGGDLSKLRDGAAVKPDSIAFHRVLFRWYDMSFMKLYSPWSAWKSLTFAPIGPDQGILIVIWDTDSAANMPYKTLGDSTVNASSIASVEPLVASSYLRTMNSIAPGSSMTTIATPMVSDIPPVRPVTGVPGLLNGGPMESAPVEAA